MENLVRYLVKRREFLKAQIRYLAAHETRLEEITDGERIDVTGDWVDRLQSEYAEISEALINAGVITEAQARSDALS